MGIPAKAPKEKVKSAFTAAKSLLDLLLSTAIILQTMRNDRNVLVAVDTAGLTYGLFLSPYMTLH